MSKGVKVIEGFRIVTEFVYPPIPIRNFDWCAIPEGYEPSDPMGYGRTEQDAIDELIDLLMIKSYTDEGVVA